jgi:ABC-type multidrug transport system fused ATPase/permease subunit
VDDVFDAIEAPPTAAVGYGVGLIVGVVAWTCCVVCSSSFTLRVSQSLHDDVMGCILSAPVDKFFERATMGQIMNRMSADTQAVDLRTFPKFVGAVVAFYRLFLPLFCIHATMPWSFLLVAAPLYCLANGLAHRYWTTMVTLRCDAAAIRSRMADRAAHVMRSSVLLRAYRQIEPAELGFCRLVDEQVKADLTSSLALRQWVLSRLLLLWSFFMTFVGLICIWGPGLVTQGALGLCLTNCTLVMNVLESSIEAVSKAQSAFMPFARLRELLSLPEERPRQRPEGDQHHALMFEVPRQGLGLLQINSAPDGEVTVSRRGCEMPLLRANPEGDGLVACEESLLSDLLPSCPELEVVDPGHCIVAANDAHRNARQIAEELCKGKGPTVWLEVRSSNFMSGVTVTIQDLKVGYASAPVDVLKGISTTIEPLSRTWLVGPAGCGKSTLLQALLRILEPRQGSILLNGVDTSKMGLGTLRQIVGLVPQESVLFSGSLHDNLDPLREYPRSRALLALQAVGFKDTIEPDSLAQALEFGPSDLSRGQRQLLALARMVMRQPALLLLDEATSAVAHGQQASLRASVRDAFPRSTLVSTAHRLEADAEIDHAIVMERGDIVEKGTLLELMSLPSVTLSRVLPSGRASHLGRLD